MYNKARNQRSTAEAQERANPCLLYTSDPEIGYGPEGDNGQGWVSGVDLGYYPRQMCIRDRKKPAINS